MNRRPACATRLLVLAASAAVLAGGCATVLNEDARMVTIQSNPPGAMAIVDGRPVGPTPVAVSLSNSDSHHIVVQAQGYGPQQCFLETSIGAGWIILDIVLGLLPLVVDAITGDWHSLQQTQCFLSLSPAMAPVGYPPTAYPPPSAHPPPAPAPR